MKLQILIPQYKETEDIIKPMLDSIMIQQGIDLNEIGVIIVNDGSNIILDDDFLESYPYEIKYYTNQHTGVSGTRNICLAAASADYVMFCDADDIFLNNCGIYLIFQAIEQEFDVFVSTFSEEIFKDGKYIYINHENDATFVHGKVYRREFLIENRIFWNSNLTIHEDSYFNYLCRACAKENRIRYCKEVFYLWKYRADSVCRKDKKYLLKTMSNMINSTMALCEELIRRNMLEHAELISYSFILNCYYDMQKKEWRDKDNEMYIQTFKENFKRFYQKFESVANLYSQDKKNQALINIRNKKYQEGVYKEFETYEQWIEQFK